MFITIRNVTVARVFVLNNLLTIIPSLYLKRLFGLKLTVSCLSASFFFGENVRATYILVLQVLTKLFSKAIFVYNYLTDRPRERQQSKGASDSAPVRKPDPQTNWPTDRERNTRVHAGTKAYTGAHS